MHRRQNPGCAYAYLGFIAVSRDISLCAGTQWRPVRQQHSHSAGSQRSAHFGIVRIFAGVISGFSACSSQQTSLIDRVTRAPAARVHSQAPLISTDARHTGHTRTATRRTPFHHRQTVARSLSLFFPRLQPRLLAHLHYNQCCKVTAVQFTERE